MSQLPQVHRAHTYIHTHISSTIHRHRNPVSEYSLRDTPRFRATSKYPRPVVFYSPPLLILWIASKPPGIREGVSIGSGVRESRIVAPRTPNDRSVRLGAGWGGPGGWVTQKRGPRSEVALCKAFHSALGHGIQRGTRHLTIRTKARPARLPLVVLAPRGAFRRTGMHTGSMSTMVCVPPGAGFKHGVC